MAARGRIGATATAGQRGPGARLDGLRLGRRAKRGERAAFAEIFRRHHQELYRYCLAIVRDRDDAEDALQATMAAALRSLPGERREIAVRPWLYRVAHNESVSILRGRRERDPDVAALADPGASQEVELATRERLRGLVADLGELPDRQRSAIVMRELSGLSHAEIGAAMSCSEAAARQAVYEARTALRERELGREMECERVRAAISDRDGRRLRSLRMRAHLKGCDGCRGFAASIASRRGDLRALYPPLPAAAAGTILNGLLGSSVAGAGGAAGAGAGAGAAGAAGGLAASAALKGGSIAAAIAIAAGAAEVGGVLPELPGPLGSKAERAAPATSEGSAGGGAADGRDAAAGTAASPEASDRGGGDRGGGGPPARGGESGRDSGGGGKAGAAPGGHSDGAASAGAPGGGGPVTPGAGGGGRSTAPGQTGSSPGGGTVGAPGQTGTAGSSSAAPGQTQAAGSASAPGQSGTAPAPASPGSGHGGGSSK